jgi:hypothetical protein
MTVITWKGERTLSIGRGRVRLTVSLSGFWFWCFGYGLMFRSHERNPPLYSERHQVRCRSWIIGGWRLTVRYPHGA